MVRRVLSREELQSIKDHPRMVKDQIAYWVMGHEGDISRVKDFSPYRHDGALSGTDTLTRVSSVPIAHEIPAKVTRFALADVPTDVRFAYVPEEYQGVHGYTVDFRKMATGKQWLGGASDTYKTHGILATGDSHTFTIRQSAYGSGVTVDNDAVAIPQLFLSPSHFGSFGSAQFCEGEWFASSGGFSDIWMGPAVFNGGDLANAGTGINYCYAVLANTVGSGDGATTWRLYRYSGGWTALQTDSTAPDPANKPVRVRLEARDQGDQILLKWWLNGELIGEYADSVTNRVTHVSSTIPGTAPGISYGHNGAVEQDRHCLWFRGGMLPETKHSTGLALPFNEELPDLVSFEKPWDGQPR